MSLALPLFNRNAIGVEISPSGVYVALMSGDANAPCLERVASRPFEGAVIRPSLRDLNILDPQAFCDRLREAHALLLHKGKRLSVTLPDSVGRVILMDVEARFKNRSEALDVIRWKLKKSLPFEPSETHLDYQQLTVRENNDLALLVTLVSRPVISQYEELMVSAGFTPARIDLNVFNLCRVFEKRLALLEQYTLISYYGGSLAVMGVRDGIPDFLRIKELPGAQGGDNRMFREISNSLLAYRERCPEVVPRTMACVTAPALAQELREMALEASAGETVPLEVKKSLKSSGQAPADQETLYPFTAAIGAALRNL